MQLKRNLLPTAAFCAATFFFGVCLLASAEAAPNATQQAKQVLDATGTAGGLVVHLGSGDGKLAAAIGADEAFLVQGLDTDDARVKQARQHVQSLGLYGRVSIDRFDGKTLPYTDDLVNLLVADELGDVQIGEVLRVLVPEGVAYVKQDGSWKKTVKPLPGDTDEWTHYLHDPTNNAVAQDDRIAPPRHMKWTGSPKWSRMHDHMSSASAMVTSGGRVFYIFDEGPRTSIQLPPSWKLIARDAYNGMILWKRDITEWHNHLWPLKSGPADLPRRLVASGDVVYATLGIHAPLVALNAAGGQTAKTYPGTTGTEEILLDDGVLFLVVDSEGEKKRSALANFTSVEAVREYQAAWTWQPRTTDIMAVDAASGETLWKEADPAAPLTLAVADGKVFYHDGEKIVCRNRADGKRLWTSEPLARWENMASWFGPTLVVYDGVVLFAGGQGMVPHRGSADTMTAIDADSGKQLWAVDHPQSGYQSPEDILVAGGLVWSGHVTSGSYSGHFTGRDLMTGEIKNEFDPNVETHWFHHRCYRAKATEKFLLMSRTGIEFLDLSTDDWTCHHWVRGACLYGIMPANGLIYTPPHPCACYIEAKLFGVTALAPPSPSRALPKVISNKGRLEKGPAYVSSPDSSPLTPNLSTSDWPTYRHDAARSGATAASVSTTIKVAWKTELGGKLTSPVVAGGKVFVAQVDTHTVRALDAESGQLLWQFTAGGRVDSPPTIYQGRVLFGSADGWVYCLCESDGELAWRYRAAPCDRRLTYFEQVESVWPVHGSVLVEDGIIYCVAGRSMFLDGGLRMLKLDPATGKKLAEKVYDDKDPESGANLQMYVDKLNMTTALPDILSSDGKRIYMRSMPIAKDGTRQRIAYLDVKQQKGEDAHLFSPTGFLDDSWWHRTFWVFGRSQASGAGGYHQSGRVAPAGRIMVFDDDSVYVYGRQPQYFRWTTPLEYHLFKADKQPEIVPLDSDNSQAAAVAGVNQRRGQAQQPRKKKAGGSRAVPGTRPTYDWTEQVPLMARAMVLADRTLFVVGPRDVIDEEEIAKDRTSPGFDALLDQQVDALEGSAGALMWAVSADDGTKLGEYRLKNLPNFDGMAAAAGRLYYTTVDGNVVSMGE